MRIDRGRGVMSEINVTPLVDVMLVLLVIFMVTAPLLQQGIDVNLPQAKGGPLPKEERIGLTIKKDGTIMLNNSYMDVKQMRAKLKAISSRNPNVFLKADRDVPYGVVVSVIAEIKGAGIEKLGMLTEPALDK